MKVPERLALLALSALIAGAGCKSGQHSSLIQPVHAQTGGSPGTTKRMVIFTEKAFLKKKPVVHHVAVAGDTLEWDVGDTVSAYLITFDNPAVCTGGYQSGTGSLLACPGRPAICTLQPINQEQGYSVKSTSTASCPAPARPIPKPTFAPSTDHCNGCIVDPGP